MPDYADFLEDEPIEAYCVRCRDTIEMEEPQPVWTRKGSPGTRGFCPVCGSTVFRMGRTDAHREMKKPAPVRVVDGPTPAPGHHSAGRHAAGSASHATYIAVASADAVFAHRLADDLAHMGIPTWLPRAQGEAVAWAGGVHPALEECTRLLVILTPGVLADEAARAAWGFFRERRKPIVLAVREGMDVPDELRRARRVDFRGDYRPALRELVQALGE